MISGSVTVLHIPYVISYNLSLFVRFDAITFGHCFMECVRVARNQISVFVNLTTNIYIKLHTQSIFLHRYTYY